MTIERPRFSSLNPYIDNLPVYNSGLSIGKARELSGKHEIARLASNENPYGCAPGARRALESGGYEPWRYPDSHCTELKRALAQRLGVAAEHIAVGNGSEELIAAISRAVLVPGDTVVTVAPSFGLHEIEPMAAGAKVIKVPLTQDMEFDVPALCAALAAGPKLVFLSSPSNPAGCILRQDGLDAVLEAVQPGTLFVLDEAYYEYAADALPDSIAMLQQTKASMVVLRTFSKAYGLAGLRVGYAITQDARMAQAISATRTPFNVNGVAQLAALEALSDQAWMVDAVCRTVVELERMAVWLRNSGFVIPPSKSNSLFFDTGKDSRMVFDALVKEGVIIKPWREPGYECYVRVSVGTEAENQRFLEAFSTQVS